MQTKTKTQSWLVLLLIVGVVLFPFPHAFVEADDSVDDLNKDIEKIEDKLKKAEERKAALEQEVNMLSASLSQTQRTISETQLKIKQAENVIERKTAEIELLETQVAEDKLLLTGLLQDLYYDGHASLPELLFSRDDFHSLISQPDSLLTVKERIVILLDSLESRQSATASEKSALEEAKADHQELLASKTAEQRSLVSDRADALDDVADQEKIIGRLRKELQELQGDLAVLTGKSYNAKDIREAVEDASRELGVPRGVLYGFLKAETNLGANTGQCTYQDVRDNAMKWYYNKNKSKYKNSIAVLEKRYKLFLDLVSALDYSKSKKVSCTPRSYVGQGGAMGVAQFMSDIWLGYEPTIRSHTGHKTPDPWNLTDGVMAMAIKLRKAGATSDSQAVIRKASISYLGAFNANYFNTIYYWSKNYKKLFD